MTGMAFVDNIFDFVSDLVWWTGEFVDNNPRVSVCKRDFVNLAFWFITLNSSLTEACIAYVILPGIQSQWVN